MKYEVYTIADKVYEPNSGGICGDFNLICPQFVCSSGAGCSNPDSGCGDNLCTNPGMGCRHGCGGAKTSACKGTTNF